MQIGWIEMIRIAGFGGVLVFAAWEYLWFKRFFKDHPEVAPALSRRALELVLLGVIAGLLLPELIGWKMELIRRYPFIM